MPKGTNSPKKLKVFIFCATYIFLWCLIMPTDLLVLLASQRNQALWPQGRKCRGKGEQV